MNGPQSPAEASQGSFSLWSPLSATDQDRLAEQYRTALPFPHLVLDNLFSPTALHAVLDEVKGIQIEKWEPHYTALQKKRLIGATIGKEGPVADYFATVSSPAFLSFLETVTGIPALQPDPTLFNGGVHEASVNGHFEIHVDFQKHPHTGLRNRLVLITYLNDNWDESCGGSLELWDIKTNKAVQVIPPVFGRSVLMSQSPTAAHGYPHPFQGDQPRRALIAYFYTDQEAGAGDTSDATVYVRRAGLPFVRRLHIVCRDILPRPLVRGLRSIQSSLVHFWMKQKSQ